MRPVAGNPQVVVGRVEARVHSRRPGFQRAVQEAVRRAGLTRRATCHTFHHTFAKPLLDDGYDIRTVLEFL
jgi:site-specific recombinase XerD